MGLGALQWRHNECLLTAYSGDDQRKQQSSASLAIVRGIHRGPVNFPRKGPVTRKMFHLMTSSCYFKVFITSPMRACPLLFSSTTSQGYLNNPIFSNFGLCAASWLHLMCYHELWSTPVNHPFSFLSDFRPCWRKTLPENYYPYIWTCFFFLSFPGALLIHVYCTVLIICLLCLDLIADCGSISVLGIS